MKKRKKPNHNKIFFSVKLAILILASCFSWLGATRPAQADNYDRTYSSPLPGYDSKSTECDLRGAKIVHVEKSFRTGRDKTIYLDQPLQLYAQLEFTSQHDKDTCKDAQGVKFNLKVMATTTNGVDVSVEDGESAGTIAKSVSIDVLPHGDSSGNFVGFKKRLPDFNLQSLLGLTNNASYKYVHFFLQVYRGTTTGANRSPVWFSIGDGTQLGSKVPAGANPDKDPVSEDGGPGGVLQPGQNSWKLGDIGVNMTGLRDKYRVTINDQFLNFDGGKSNQADAITGNWSNPQVHPNPGDAVDTKQTNNAWTYDYTPYFNSIFFGLAYRSDIQGSQCEQDTVSGNDPCPNVIFQEGTLEVDNKTLPHAYDTLGVDLTKRFRNDPSVSFVGLTAGSGKHVDKGFMVLPVIRVTQSHLGIIGAGRQSYHYIVLTNVQSSTFTVEMYASDGDIKQACKNDGNSEEFCSNINNAKYKIGKEIAGAATGNNTERTNPGGVTSPLWWLLSQILVTAVTIANAIIYVVFAFIVLPMIQGILSIHVYTDGFVNVILPGWLILRNLANIVLILGMLMIGLGTLFRIERYNYKHLLVQLILAAVAVNFSLVIGQAVLGVADTVQNQFLPAENCGITDAIAGTGKVCTNTVIGALAKKLMLDPATNLFNLNITSATVGSLIPPLISFWLAVMSFFVFLAVAAFLVIRLVFLWVLLMVSPVAYAANVIPSTQQYFTRWWKEFIKYAFTVPIFAFFLNMAALLAVKLQDSGFNSLFQISGADQTIVALAFTVTTNLLIMGFLIFGLMFAQSTGTYAADGITKFARKAGDLPLTKGVPWGAEMFHAKTGIEVRPTKWIEGWNKSREITQRRRQASGLAKATSRDSTLGNPTAFWQRNWSPQAITRQMTWGNRRGRVHLENAAELRKQAEGLEGKAEDPSLTEAERQAFIQESNQLYRDAYRAEERGKALVNPTDFETQHELRKAISEEKNDIHAESWEELVDLAQASHRDGNFPRFQAIMQKLAETYNENEAASHMRYLEDKIDKDGTVHKKGDFFDQSSRGLADFYQQYVGSSKGFGLGDQAALRALTDVSDIAEQQRHYGVMRIVDNKHGEFKIKEEDEVDLERGTEKGKLAQQRLAADANRLGDHYEYTSLDGRVRFDLAQQNAVKRIVTGSAQQRFFIGRGIMNRSNIKAHAARYNIMKMIREVDEMGTGAGSVGSEFIEVRDRNGNVVKDSSGEPVKITRRQDALGTILSVIDAGDKEWTRAERVSHEKALEERVKRGSLDQFEIDRLKKAGYLKEDGSIDQNKMGSVDDLRRQIDQEIHDKLKYL